MLSELICATYHSILYCNRRLQRLPECSEFQGHEWILRSCPRTVSNNGSRLGNNMNSHVHMRSFDTVVLSRFPCTFTRHSIPRQTWLLITVNMLCLLLMCKVVFKDNFEKKKYIYNVALCKIRSNRVVPEKLMCSLIWPLFIFIFFKGMTLQVATSTGEFCYCPYILCI